MDVRRLLPLTGLAFVAIIIVGVAAISGSTPDTDASPSKVLSYYDAHSTRESVAAFVLAVAAALLATFGVALASALWPAEAGRRPLWQRLLVVGSTLTAGVMLVGAFVHFALADGADTGAPENALQALNLLDGDIWVAFNAALGVMMLGAAGSLIPRAGASGWLGWTALVLGVALFIPFADFIALLVAGLWIIVVSVMLFLERGGLASVGASRAV
jgi:hypothetical protein